MTAVAIIQPYVPEYRVAFFSSLRERLHQQGVSLVVAHGDPPAGAAARNDSALLPWSQRLPVRNLSAAGRTLRWRQLGDLPSVDLVIFEQAIGNLESLIALLSPRPMRDATVALWGHGRTRGHAPSAAEASLKRVVTNRSDWFFAYTTSAARGVVADGFPEDRVTVVNNSLAGVPRSSIGEVTTVDVVNFRERFRITGSAIGVYIGGLDGSKRLSFLFDAAERIARVAPDFQLVIGGDGLLRPMVEANQAPWLRYVGRVGHQEKAILSRLGSLMLIPGAVGLVAVDSFALGLPVVSTVNPHHGPEFDYLEHGINAWITRDDPEAYASEVAVLLADAEVIRVLAGGCAESAERYTLEGMVTRFADGIYAALARGAR